MPTSIDQARQASRMVMLASLANILFTMVALLIFVVRADDAQQAAEQSQTASRRFNCALVAEALDAYTEGLIAGNPDQSPESLAELERRRVVLQDIYIPILQECR